MNALQLETEETCHILLAWTNSAMIHTSFVSTSYGITKDKISFIKQFFEKQWPLGTLHHWHFETSSDKSQLILLVILPVA